MYSHKRRPIAAVLTLAVAALGLTACTAGTSNSNDNTITLFAPQDATSNLNTNDYTKLIEKKFNVKLKFETTTYDGGAAAEKRQISLASGDYPDAYLLIPWVNQFNRAELLKFAKQGVIVPLNGLLKDAPNIEKAFADHPDYKAADTAPDGKIYGLSQWNDCFHCSYGAKLWMNTPWLKKLGLKQPTTPDELFNVLEAFKTQDPNGNGKADEIPLSGSVGNSILPYLMNAYIYLNGVSVPAGADPTSLGLDSGGKVQLQAAQDQWRDGLKFIQKLWKAGLIDPAAFTQNGDALKAEGDNADAVIVGSFTGLHPAILTTLGQKDGRDKEYDAVPPLTGPAGQITPHAFATSPGATFVITNKASAAKQKKLIQILNFIYSTQGNLLGEFGAKGVGWTDPGPDDVALDSTLKPLFKAIPQAADKTVPNNIWGALVQYYSDSVFRNSQVQPTDIYAQTGYERRLFEATKLYSDHAADKETFPYWNVWIPADKAADLATAQTNVETLVQTAAAAFVTGSQDINSDADWQTYLNGLKSNGESQYIKIYADAWKK